MKSFKKKYKGSEHELDTNEIIKNYEIKNIKIPFEELLTIYRDDKDDDEFSVDEYGVLVRTYENYFDFIEKKLDDIRKEIVKNLNADLKNVKVFNDIFKCMKKYFKEDEIFYLDGYRTENVNGNEFGFCVGNAEDELNISFFIDFTADYENVIQIIKQAIDLGYEYEDISDFCGYDKDTTIEELSDDLKNDIWLLKSAIEGKAEKLVDNVKIENVRITFSEIFS